jgi:hypothetical protein
LLVELFESSTLKEWTRFLTAICEINIS